MILIARTADKDGETCTVLNARRLAVTERVVVTRTSRIDSADDFIEVEIGVLGLDDCSFEEFIHFE